MKSNSIRRSIIFERIFDKLNQKITDSNCQQTQHENVNQSSDYGDNSSSQNRDSYLQNISDINLNEKNKLRQSFIKLRNNMKRSKLNAIIQSEKIDFTKQDEIKVSIFNYQPIPLTYSLKFNQVLLSSIKNQSKTLLEAKLTLMAFQQLDFFKNKQIFQINENTLSQINSFLQVHQFEKYDCIQHDRQSTDRIFILIKGKAALLRVQSKRKQTYQTFRTLNGKSTKLILSDYQLAQKRRESQEDYDNSSDSDIEVKQFQPTKATLKHIEFQSEPHSQQHLNDKQIFFENRILQDKIKILKSLNEEVLKKNYSYALAKKEALGKYMSKRELILRLVEKFEQTKQEEVNQPQINSEDEEFIRENYQMHELTKILNIGDYFCEDSLIYQTKHNGDIISLDDNCVAISLSREGFESIVTHYYLKIIGNWLYFLKQYKFLEPMMERDIINIIPDLQEIYLRKNNTLFKEGDATDIIYFLYQGQIELQQCYSIQELNQIALDQRNKRQEQIDQSSRRDHQDISNNKPKKRNPPLQLNNLGLSVNRTNKDKTKLNKLSIAKDNIKNMRLVTLYQFTPGSFCGDKEFFEQIDSRQNRAIVVSHEAIVLSIKTQMNKTLEIMRVESEKKNQFYFKRTVDYILLNQNFNKKKSIGTSELIEIINFRKKINIQAEEEQKQEVDHQQDQNQIELHSENLSLQPDQFIKQSLKNKNTIQNQDQIAKQKQNEVLYSATKKIGSRRGSKQINEGTFEFQHFEGIDQLNKSLLKKMNILKQGDSIFDSSIPKYLKEVIIQKIKQLRHLTPASVKGVIQKVISEQHKYRSSSAQKDSHKKQQQLQQQQQQQQTSPSPPQKQIERQRPKTAFVKRFEELDLSRKKLHAQQPNFLKRSKEKDFKNPENKDQSRSMIFQNQGNTSRGYISLEKKQSIQQEIISKLSENRIRQMFKAYKQGKKNFKQIFLQSIVDQQEKEQSVQKMNQGIKIENIMKEKREKNFQEYMNDELEYNKIRILKRKSAMNKQASIMSEDSINKGGSQGLIEIQQDSEKLTQPNKFIKKKTLNLDNNRIKSASVIRRAESYALIQSEPSSNNILSQQNIQYDANNAQQIQSQHKTHSPIAALSRFHKSSLQLNLTQESHKQDKKIQRTKNPSILESLSEKGNQENPNFQNSGSEMSQNSEKQQQISILKQDSRHSNTEGMLTTGRNETIELVAQTAEKSQSFKNANNNNNEMMINDFLTDRVVPQTKRQQQLFNSQQSPLTQIRNSNNIDLAQQVQSSRRQASFANLKEQKRIQKFTDQSLHQQQDEEQIHAVSKQSKPLQLLMTMGEYDNQKVLTTNSEMKKSDELEKITELLQQNKRLNIGRSTQFVFRSPQTNFKIDKIIQNDSQVKQKNKSFFVGDYQPSSSPILKPSNQQHRKLSSSSSWLRDTRQITIADTISPRTNPITYSTLSSQISNTKNQSTKEINIHKLSLEKVKQKQINLPISMSIRKKFFSQNNQQYQSPI